MRQWLKKLRIATGLSTYKVAKLAGISQSYYASIEAGVRGNPLNVDVAKKIAEALGFNWTMFYDEDIHEKAVNEIIQEQNSVGRQ